MTTEPKIFGFYGLLAAIYISLWIGIGIASVGQTKGCNPGVYEWDLPFLLAAVVILPFVMGYLEGGNK